MNLPSKLKMIVAYPLMVALMGSPIFLTAWTLNYWQAWVFISVFAASSTIHGLILLKYAPDVLARRMKAGPTAETRPVQRVIMTLITASFFLFLALCGLDHRLGWSHVPAAAVIFGDLLIAFSFVIFTKVCLENHFASATIELHEGQNVVDTGMYGVVRHPMYAGALLLLLGIPLSLGSVWSIAFIIVAVSVLIWRIVDEEKFLLSHLKGYAEYCQKVKYRLIPGLY